jgi:hypothetical protein
LEIRDWITIVSAVIVVAGWFVNSYLNRRHEIAKKRMEYRFDALLSFLPVLFAIQENRTTNDEFSREISLCWTKFQLYCYKDEAKAFEKILTAIKNKDEKKYSESVSQVARIVKDRVRKELGLDDFELIQK